MRLHTDGVRNLSDFRSSRWPDRGLNRCRASALGDESPLSMYNWHILRVSARTDCALFAAAMFQKGVSLHQFQFYGSILSVGIMTVMNIVICTIFGLM